MKRDEAFSAFAFATTVAPAGSELPDSIQWMPPGPQDVQPSVNGKPMRLKFDVTPDIATEFNKQLQDMRADAKAGNGDEPYIDFNHEDRERAGEVVEFYWGGDDPKAGGVRARINWSAAGKEAVLGKNYRRFSPQWDFHPTTHKPTFISENLGGLVNRAAFRNIAPVVAKNAGASTTTTTTQMNETEFKKIVDDALKPIGDRLNTLETRIPATPATAAARQGTENNTTDIGKVVETALANAMKPVTDRMDKVEKETKQAQARAAVDPHIRRGAMAPQDADGITMWENMWIANAKVAEAQMAKLPGAKGGRITSPTTGADANNPGTGVPQDEIMTAAAKLVEKDPKLSMAEAVIAVSRSSSGSAQYKEFRSSFVLGRASAKN